VNCATTSAGQRGKSAALPVAHRSNHATETGSQALRGAAAATSRSS